MQRNLKLWREAASIIVLAKNFTPKDKWNYKILTIKRSKSMKFMPNVNTFPGGVLEQSDSAQDWIKLYESFGLGDNYFNKISHGQKAPIFKNYKTNELPRYISLRINAIRETFEECGILFCKPAGSKNDSIWASCLEGENMKQWQDEVHKDSSKFLEMCYKFKIYPDIESLHAWSNWLTPFAMPQQFDTIFFVAAIEKIPPTNADVNEIQDIEWCTPYDYLKMSKERHIMFPVPQFYEISKMYNIYNIDKLLETAHEQSNKGCNQILPYRLSIAGKNMIILPGDDLYPDEEKLRQKELMKMDALPESKVMHRIILENNFVNDIVINDFMSSNLLPFTYKKNKI